MRYLKVIIHISILFLICNNYFCTPKPKETEGYKYIVDSAWERHDSVYFRNYILSLDTIKFPEFAVKINYLSEITGFGWALIDPFNDKYQSNDTSNAILRQNMLTGFRVYQNSKLFMRKIPIILMHNYFYYESKRLISEEEQDCVLRFSNDIADSTFYFYYFKAPYKP
jgi:hypothetical protein